MSAGLHATRQPTVTPADVADRAPFDAHGSAADPSHGRDSHGHHDAYAGRPVHDGAGHDERESERGLRGLVGGGSTQVSVAAAMRARDSARPTDKDVAYAEANLTIVHRGWTPRDPA
jgi:hypothetical protein